MIGQVDFFTAMEATKEAVVVNAFGRGCRSYRRGEAFDSVREQSLVEREAWERGWLDCATRVKKIRSQKKVTHECV